MAVPRRLLTTLARPCIRSNRSNIRRSTRRFLSEESISHPSNQVQVYISRSSDPYLNLSIEHFLLQKSHPDSVVLFLYTNRPCVVVGRNQNPWVEVNLGLLKHNNGIVSGNRQEYGDENQEKGEVLLVRRRSGGGTVFHDLGNVNYSVICPHESFDRDRYASMVVRALSSLSIPSNPDARFRVNERHDIVLDLPPSPSPDSSFAKQQTPTQTQTFKISGSAYKITRLRALHHGTCLLSSPNLPLVGPLLRSPAAPYIKSRGVQSVRSPIRNIGISDLASFEDAVVAEFDAMHGAVDTEVIDAQQILDDEPLVAKGYAELTSPEWIYTQTPQFTFSTHPTDADPRPRPPLPASLPPSLQLSMTVHHGEITEASESYLRAPIKNTSFLQITDWRTKAADESVGRWLNGLFGLGEPTLSHPFTGPGYL
ncbi:hypothetical protein F4781DRAFT_308319 [Annulohypoxylon bovei var. microspora]|nr:hypothetical protein F4781DRAFT_308319 [Annulohypoxylon bovei var. microspora]